MNKKVLVGAIILLLLLAGGAVLLMSKSSNNPTTGTTTGGSAQGTLKSLFASGKSQKCTFSNSTTDASKVNGTVYVANGKMRGDFASTVSGTAMGSHMIMDGQTSYVWTDASKQGFKMDMGAVQQANGNTTAANSQGPDLNQSVNYSCESWTVDNSLLSLPADVTFTSFTMPSMATPAAGTGTTGTTSQCAMCAGLPAGASQDACKAQLHCQ